MCVQAKDYIGCVKAQTTKSSEIPTVRVIEGKTEISGNSCPNGFRYANAGICREVVRNNLHTIFTPDAIGLWRANWGPRPKGSFFYVLGGEITKSVYDPKCPDREPIIYTQSSCQEDPTVPSLSDLRRIFTFRRLGWTKDAIKYWDDELDELYGVKNLASDAKKYRPN